ncbi:MAG: hypothetical protein FVQ77_12120 [Cytophagales bacterium]|nr:hypothetical protein [Cytophagales bacterium]
MKIFKLYLAPALVAILTGTTYFYSYSDIILEEMPWIRYSIVLTINTSGWSYAFAYLKSKGHLTSTIGATILFGILFCPMTILLLLPSYDDFGELATTGLITTMVIINIIHCSFFYIIQKSHDKNKT